MTDWIDQDKQRFLAAFNSYWPGRLKLQDPNDESVRTWLTVVRMFNVQVAMQSLKDIFETQEQSRPPTPAAFKSIAMPMQKFIAEKARLAVEERRTGEKLMTAHEVAADDSIWEPRFDAAVSEKHLKFLKGLRRHLQGGGTVLEAVRGYV